MSIRITQNSFSRGILSPALYGRYDLNQYTNGVKKLNNGIVLQEGNIVNRAGLEFIEKTKYQDKKCRLISFNYGNEQNYIIEIGEYYFRFIKDGAYLMNNNEIYEIVHPYKQEDLFELDYVQQADVITFVHKNYKPAELSRIDSASWNYKKIEFRAKINPPQNVSAIYTGSTSSNTVIYKYLVCSVEKETSQESTRSDIANVIGHKEAYWTTSEYITISWDKVENAEEYNIYRCVNGIYGYIGTSSELSFIDNNIEPDLTSCAPVYKNPFETENPNCVCYYQQRKVYANLEKTPQGIYASQSGTNDNFNISKPLNSTDALNLILYDNYSSPIQHLIPFDDLIVMTSNGEWCVNGSDGVFCANPAPVAKLQSCYGSSKIKPVISGSMVIFVQSGGNIVRDLGYNYLSDSYDGEELTLFANHLFEGKKIIDMSYSKEPYRILWCVMDDGTLNGLTYNPKQQICAWHTHSTKGEFESVTTIRENNEDISYFVIKRTINNETVRYIERLKTRVIKSLKDSFFLDCALNKEFSQKVSQISGLEHLKNETVDVLLDFGVVKDLKVDENGVLKLPYEANNVVVGLNYAFELETLNLEGEGSLGINKILNKAEIKLLNSRLDFITINDNKYSTSNARSLESYINPQKLYSDTISLSLLTNPTKEATVKISQKNPLPICILAISSTLNLESVESA